VPRLQEALSGLMLAKLIEAREPLLEKVSAMKEQANARLTALAAPSARGPSEVEQQQLLCTLLSGIGAAIASDHRDASSDTGYNLKCAFAALGSDLEQVNPFCNGRDWEREIHRLGRNYEGVRTSLLISSGAVARGPNVAVLTPPASAESPALISAEGFSLFSPPPSAFGASADETAEEQTPTATPPPIDCADYLASEVIDQLIGDKSTARPIRQLLPPCQKCLHEVVAELRATVERQLSCLSRYPRLAAAVQAKSLELLTRLSLETQEELEKMIDEQEGFLQINEAFVAALQLSHGVSQPCAVLSAYFDCVRRTVLQLAPVKIMWNLVRKMSGAITGELFAIPPDASLLEESAEMLAEREQALELLGHLQAVEQAARMLN